MIIRILTSEDAMAYRTLRLQALTLNPEAFATTYEDYVLRPIERVASQLPASDDRFTLGAFDGEGQLIGTVTLIREASPKVRHIAEVLAMYVAADTRRRGVGRALLVDSVKRARAMEGLEQLRLCVIEDNQAAVSLYESIGFRAYGVEPNALKDAERAWNEIHMVMLLSDQSDRGETGSVESSGE